MAFKLYELNAQYQELLDLISDTEVDHASFADTLESIEEAIEDKLENTAKVIKSLEAEAKAIKVEEDRMKKRRQALENNAARLKDYAEQSLIATGKERIKGNTFTLRLQYNPPSVTIHDEKAIPAHYLIDQVPSIDKKGILEDLKNEIAVEGASLHRVRSLRIV